MLTIQAVKVRQFGVEFFQTTFTSSDIQKLVKFEVLSYSSPEEREKKARAGKSSAINWELLEKRIAQSEAAFQRPVIRKKSGNWSSIIRSARRPRTYQPSQARSS